MAADKISVLFVCLGNICRSTMAEGVFQATVKNSAYTDRVREIDSCGTGAWHVGSDPDSRTTATLLANGITDYWHRARKIVPADFDRFDYILAMDRANLRDIRRMQKARGGAGAGRAKVMLFGEFCGTPGKAEVIEDPYYGGAGGFEAAYEQATRFSANFLAQTFPDVDAGAAQAQGLGGEASS